MQINGYCDELWIWRSYNTILLLQQICWNEYGLPSKIFTVYYQKRSTLHNYSKLRKYIFWILHMYSFHNIMSNKYFFHQKYSTHQYKSSFVGSRRNFMNWKALQYRVNIYADLFWPCIRVYLIHLYY